MEWRAGLCSLSSPAEVIKAMVHPLIKAMVDFDGFHIGCDAGASWLRSVGEACRKAAEEEASDGELTCSQILETIAQPEVDRWRAAHRDSVHAQYIPEVPQGELDAIREVFDKARDRTDDDIMAHGQLARTSGELMQYRSQTGREAVPSFWDLETTFVRQLHEVEASAE